MKAIILAAGRGSRLGGLTETRPKCLVEVMGRPLLDWQMRALRAAGIDDIGIVRGYRGAMLEGRGATLFENRRWAETNMVVSLAAAAEWLGKEACIVSYADIFYAPEAVRGLAAAEAEIALTYDSNWQALWSRRFSEPLADAETFRIGADARILEIGGKPHSAATIQGQYMGLLRITPGGWQWIAELIAAIGPAAADRLDMTGMLQRLIDRGKRIVGVPYRGPWGEVDSPSDIALYEGQPDLAAQLKAG